MQSLQQDPEFLHPTFTDKVIEKSLPRVMALVVESWLRRLKGSDETTVVKAFFVQVKRNKKELKNSIPWPKGKLCSLCLYCFLCLFSVDLFLWSWPETPAPSACRTSAARNNSSWAFSHQLPCPGRKLLSSPRVDASGPYG
jgi:hypothetical protein